MAAKKKKIKAMAKKENPVELIQKKPNAFVVGSVALLLGAVAGVLLVQQRAPVGKPPVTNDTKATPSLMQQNLKQKTFTEYTLRENESLSEVAQRFYNDPNKYTKIAQDNNLANPDVVAPGTKIRLYDLP